MLSTVKSLRSEFDKLSATLSRLSTPKVPTVPQAPSRSASSSLDNLRRGQLDELVNELRKRL